MTVRLSKSGIQRMGERREADTMPPWVDATADLTLLLNEEGIICGLSCRDVGLWQELEGAAAWPGETWSSTATWETNSAVASLLRSALAGSDLEQRHVDHLTSRGRSVPMLYAVARAENYIVASGHDLRSMDLANIVLKHDASVGRAYAKAMRARGIKLETLWLDVLAPVARRLGDLWLEDACSFTDVTIALGHLQEVLRDTVPPVETAHGIIASKRILLASSPGEQHVLGLTMLAGLFRQDGWYVRQENDVTEATLGRIVAQNSFALIGLSASDEVRIKVLADCIRKIRRVSCNRDAAIMVGGKLFTDRPELVSKVGADFTAHDARQAVYRAQRVLDGYQNKSMRS